MAHQLKKTDISEFQAELRLQERSPATVEKYGRDLLAFYRWLPAGKGVDRERVAAYKAHLAGRYAPASVNSMQAALRTFFRLRGWGECAVKLLRIQRRVFARKGGSSPGRTMTACWRRRRAGGTGS